MMRAFLCEIKKAHRRHDWVIIFGTLAIIALWVGGTVLQNTKPEQLPDMYWTLLFSFPMINTVILSLCTAVLASRIWDVENKGNTYKLLFTLQTPDALYGSKLMLGALDVLIIVLADAAVIPLIAKMAGATGALPLPAFGWYILSTAATSLMLFFLELVLSIAFRTQVPALAIGLGGALIGLFSAYLPPFLGRFLPWGYFMQGLCVAMDWNQQTRITHYYQVPYPFWTLAVLAAVSAVLIVTGRRLVLKKEV